jgi:hypothetical protein
MDNIIVTPKVYDFIYKFMESSDFVIKSSVSEFPCIISSKNDINFNLVYFEDSDNGVRLQNTLLVYETTFKKFDSYFNDFWRPVIADFLFNKFGKRVDEIFIVQ